MAYKILSLSGGGARGIYQAVFLKSIAASFPASLCKSFDLIAGTSTGSIVAAGLAYCIDLDRIVMLFESKTPEIFDSKWFAGVRSGPRYQSRPLREQLVNVFGENTTLGEATTPLLIAATVLNRYAPRAFSSFHEPGVVYEDNKCKIVDLIMASCAAPSYFEPVKVGKRTYVDGGMWANSPSTDAVISVYYYLKQPLNEIKVLSIGNGEVAQGSDPSKFVKLRPISHGMITSVLDMMFAAQSIASDEMVEMLLPKDNFIHIDSSLDKVIELDNATVALSELPARAEADAAKHLPKIIQFVT